MNPERYRAVLLSKCIELASGGDPDEIDLSPSDKFSALVEAEIGPRRPRGHVRIERWLRHPGFAPIPERAFGG